MTLFATTNDRASADATEAVGLSVAWPSAWLLPVLSTILGGLGLALVVSTQYLFQPFVWRNWPLDEVLWGWLEILRDRAVVAVCIALGFAIARRIRLSSPAGRTAAVGLGIALGAMVGEALLMGRGAPAAASDATMLMGRALRWSSVAAAVAGLLHLRARSVQADSEIRRVELARLDGETQLANLRLQALRAQIEPHFLFNTLATVRRLGSTDPHLRECLLDHLHTFIRLSIEAQPGDRHWTLGDEVELVRAYLGVLVVRMDGRLVVTYDIDVAVLRCELPPLMLATLVENAVKHGITPSTTGGTISVTAQRRHGLLEVAVADTGVGFQASGGSGIGLANTRARLRSLHAGRATLELSANQPRGVFAVLKLPAATVEA